MKMKTKGILLVFISLFLVSQAVAGWVIKEVTTNYEGDKDTTIIYAQKNMIKSVDSQIMIFNLEKGLIYFIVPERKIYWRGTPDEFQNGMEEGKKQMMEEQLKKMNPEQREAYKKYKKKNNYCILIVFEYMIPMPKSYHFIKSFIFYFPTLPTCFN